MMVVPIRIGPPVPPGKYRVDHIPEKGMVVYGEVDVQTSQALTIEATKHGFPVINQQMGVFFDDCLMVLTAHDSTWPDELLAEWTGKRDRGEIAPEVWWLRSPETGLSAAWLLECMTGVYLPREDGQRTRLSELAREQYPTSLDGFWRCGRMLDFLSEHGSKEFLPRMHEARFNGQITDWVHPTDRWTAIFDRWEDILSMLHASIGENQSVSPEAMYRFQQWLEAANLVQEPAMIVKHGDLLMELRFEFAGEDQDFGEALLRALKQLYVTARTRTGGFPSRMAMMQATNTLLKNR